MATETDARTVTVKAPPADVCPGKEERKCPVGGGGPEHRGPGEAVKRLWRECQEESFWYRALPLSVASMTVTGGLIYNGIWKASKRFGPFPKLAVAGILGYAVGKASYMRTCRRKFKELGLEGPGPGSGPGPWSEWRSGRGHRSCHHVCEECKKTSPEAAAEQVKN